MCLRDNLFLMGRNKFLHGHITNRNGVARRALAHLELENQVVGRSVFGNVKFADIIFILACCNVQFVQAAVTFLRRAVVIADLETKSLIRRNTCRNLIVCPRFQLRSGIYE